MKIYEIGTGYTPIPAQMGAATEIVVEELTRSLRNNGEDAEIIDIQAGERAPLDLPLSEVKVPAVFTKTDVSLGLVHKLKRVIYSVSLARYLKNLLKSTSEQVVLHFHNQYNLFFALKLIPKRWMKKAIVAYTVHSYIWHGAWDEIASDIQRRYFQERYCVKHADMVFVLNERTKHNLLAHIGVAADRVRLVDNGVNTDVYYSLTAAERDRIKSNLNLSDKKVFVQVGSVCPRKGQLEALQLLLPLLKQDPNAVFCYAGGLISREYHAAIADAAAENGVQDRVIYVGELKPGAAINDVYNAAEAMVFPSKAEGFSLVIIEAMSAGVPVIIPHTLQFDLADRCLRYNGDREFTELLTTQILNPQIHTTLKQQSRRVAVERYSWNAVAADYASVFHRMVSAH